MRITARFDGRCAACGKPTPKGSEIEYIDKKAYHAECNSLNFEATPSAEQYALADKLGFRHFSWIDLQPMLHGTPDEPERLDGDSRERDSDESVQASSPSEVSGGGK